MGVLHVLHEGFTAEEELVTDGTASGVGAAEKGGVLLEHNTLLQLLVWPIGYADTRVTPDTNPELCTRSAGQAGTEQNDTSES